MITRIIHVASEILFPSSCYECKKEGESFCRACIKKLQRTVDTPSPSITSIYSSKDPTVKRAIHAIKYFHRKDLIEPFTRLIVKELQEKHLEKMWILVPIPMPKLRYYIRGYNHAEAIAHEISKKTGIATNSKILIRAIGRKRQVMTLSRNERIKNQKNVFKMQQEVQGMNIILIDDVTTTGATLLEAKKVLLEKGARTVQAYTIAH